MEFEAQSQQLQTVSRRPLDIEDYIDMFRRHRSWILGPAFLGLVAGVVIAFLWPDKYMSVGAIRVVPPQVPQRLVAPNISEDLADRITSMYQAIKSRPNLTNLITTYNLYPEDRNKLPIEDIIEQMKRDIVMSPIQGIARFNSRTQTGLAFSISYSYKDRRAAQKVCRDLLAKFVEDSIRQRSSQSNSTTQFFQDQLAMAQKQLDKLDKDLADFRSKNVNELPEREVYFLNRIATMENNLQGINASLSRANQEKLQLEGTLRGLKEEASVLVPSSKPEQRAQVQRNERVVELERELNKLESSLALLRETYKDDYPDVQRLMGIVNSKKQQLEQVKAELEAAATAPQPVESAAPQRTAPIGVTREQAGLISKMAQVQSSIQAKDLEIEELTRQLTETRRRISTTQSQFGTRPGALQEYNKISSERATVAARAESLSMRLQESFLASDLENRKQGEILELLEDANLPTEPYAPKRIPLILAGLALGAVLGLSVAGFREVKDTSLKNLKDVRAYTKLMVLGSIPLLENDFVVRRRRRMAILGWVVALFLGILMMSGSMFYYFAVVRT